MSYPIKALPEIQVEAEGVPLTAGELYALAEIRVQQRLSLPALCELAFSDVPGPLTGARRFEPGTALRVMVIGQQEPLFVGQVTAVEYCYGPTGDREIRVRGYDLLHRLRKRQPVRAHVQVTTRDLAQELVADLGLTVQAAESGPLWTRLMQYRQSDLELLQEVAERCGLYLAVRGNTLHLLTLQGIGEAVPLALGETLLEARIEVNADAACRSVTAVGWDTSRIETHEGQVSQARIGRVVSEEVLPARVGGSGKRELVDEGTPGDDHATALAQAELDQRLAREVIFWGVAEGNTRLQVGTPVEVTGVVDSVAGRYVLSSVTHTIDGQKGFLSEISSAPPARRPEMRGSAVAPGVVTQIDDPEKLGRVRVSLPTYGNLETDWMGVLSAGAGTGKGFMTLPDIGDHVLVLFAHEDPGQGIVLGGLYGAHEPPDTGIDGGVVRRYTLLTPGGQRIRLDDGQRSIRLENSDGSYYELSPHKVQIHAAVDLEIEAPGQRVVIRGKNIDFERG
ncbi:MAG TPA: phage baseplate assembly protein V [Ktedonobacteraceae bacterium]|nr:phage baseplate assembly protein V [Ktedonobacteraceae bacterium]